MRKSLIIGIIFILGIQNIFGQINLDELKGKKLQLASVAFYNLENLFDTIVDPDTNLILRKEFTPLGSKDWNTKKYYIKLDHLAKVLSQIGTDLCPTGPVVIGVAEVENQRVLEDLINRPMLKNRNYKIAHFDSPDERGIDVAFLYQPNRFVLEKAWIRRENSLPHNDKTRDMLAMYGKLDGEPFYFIVDHWPSRWGGQKRSEPLRDTVAKHDRMIIDSIVSLHPDAKIIFMGDLNDDPIDESVKTFMNATGNLKKIGHEQMYDPMVVKYKNGIGTLAYRDAWDLFDQFIMTQNLLGGDISSYKFASAHIFNKKWMTQSEGKFAGYPYRTYVGDKFVGGYSDHFPVYLFLAKEKK